MREWGHTQHSCDRDVEGAQVGLTKEAVVDRRDEAGHDEDDDARIVQPPYCLHQAAVSTARGRPSSSKAVTGAVQLQLAATAAASGMAGLPLIWEVLNPNWVQSCRPGSSPLATHGALHMTLLPGPLVHCSCEAAPWCWNCKAGDKVIEARRAVRSG